MFYHLPTVEEMQIASPQVNVYTGAQILNFACQWTSDHDGQLDVLNYLFGEIDRHGAEAWPDLRWQMLMSRINNLSTQINEKISRYAHR